MPERSHKRLMIAVQSDRSDSLESLRVLGSDEFRTGEVQKKQRVGEARLDPAQVAEMAYQVVCVVGAIGGAVQFIDWVVQKLKQARATEPVLRIQIGDTKLEVSGSQDAELLRKQLRVLLHVEAV